MNTDNEAASRAVQRLLYARCSDCACPSDAIHAAGGRCPRMVATTEPGELSETRENRQSKPNAAFAFICVGAVLACWGAAAWLAAFLRGLQQ